MKNVTLNLSENEALVLWDIIKDHSPMELAVKLQDALEEQGIDLNKPTPTLPSTASMNQVFKTK